MYIHGGQYQTEQLDPIVNQSYRDIEIIIVDDCSTDNTLKILSVYADRDPRIRIISNEANIGFVRNFEKAINESVGGLIELAD